MRCILIGFGVVGQAFAALLRDQAAQLALRMGTNPTLVAVVDSRGIASLPTGLDIQTLLNAKAQGQSVGETTHGRMIAAPTDVDRLIREIDADVVIETSPSNLKNPTSALNHIFTAFRSGKHVISANKAPLAVAMPALVETRTFNNMLLRYSATVGAGTPILATARILAKSDRIVRIEAIINGTTNYILHQMHTKDQPFAQALAQAQELGYAETDPSNDIDGIDTAMKLTIIANHVARHSQPRASKTPGTTIDKLSISGIGDVSTSEITTAKSHGRAVKLLGVIDEDGKASVARTAIDEASPLNVANNLNAVTFTTERVGPVTIVGRGAGGTETATALLRDLVDIHQTLSQGG